MRWAALILAVPVSAALALVGAATLASVPLLRPVRKLDPLLAERREVASDTDSDPHALSADRTSPRPDPV